MLFGHRTKSNSQKINANRTKSNVRLSSSRTIPKRAYVVSQYNLNRAKSITISAGFDLVIGELIASLVDFYFAMQKYFA